MTKQSLLALVALLALMAIAPDGSGSTTSAEASIFDEATPVADTARQGILAPDSAAVDVRDYVYEDQASGTSDTTLAIGGTVTWTVSYGDHSITHSLARPLGFKIGPGPFFDSGYKSSYSGKGDTYTQTFDLPGVHSYSCIVHPEYMQGTITVVA